MTMQTRSFVQTVLLLVMLMELGCTHRPILSDSNSQTELHTIFFVTNNTRIPVNVEIAATNASRARGLMNRKTLKATHGMLFIFPDEAKRRFWMKNTYIPLDMIFVNQGLTTVGVVHNAKPHTLEGRGVPIPSTYVVEVNAGFARKHAIGTGTKLLLDQTLLELAPSQ